MLGEDDGKETNDAQNLVEFMGRLCYKSWEPGLNKNVTKIREDQNDYLKNILMSAHGSVLEHAHFSFALHDISRVVTAELNRHRAGIAISEQSLRYVRLDELRFRVPPTLNIQTQGMMRDLVQHIEQVMAAMMQCEDLDNPDLDFNHKKMVTSALRHAAPLGLLTEEGWTANVRSIRHVIEMRSARHAEESIRLVAHQLAQIMQSRCPALFGDYEPSGIDAEGQPSVPSEWTTPYRKV